MSYNDFVDEEIATMSTEQFDDDESITDDDIEFLCTH
jgi:hypothetical protein